VASCRASHGCLHQLLGTTCYLQHGAITDICSLIFLIMCQLFGGEPEGKTPLLRRPRRRWEFNIKMDLQEAGCGNMD
jgi:hypothetical protein